MKKKINVILVLLVIAFLVGCENINRPSSWNMEESSDWSVRASGTIIKIEFLQEENSKDVDYQFTFDDASSVIVGNVRDIGLMKQGQYGALYKYGGDYDHRSWFQWIQKEKPSNEPRIEEKVIIKEVKIAENKIEKPAKVVLKPQPQVVKHEWKRGYIEKPEPYKLVLIKLQNKIIAIAYINGKEEWKLNVNQYKMLGGPPISDVEEWKEINLN
jgi:hypothetical protein